MIKIDKFSYKSLRKLTVGERLNAVKNPQIGNSLMSALTPTQIAELFPRYYLMREPDISGFLKAVPSSVQAAKQRYYDEQIQNTVSGAREGAPLAPGAPGVKKTWWDKVKETVSGGTARVMKPGEKPQYKLTDEQRATYDLLKSGQNIDANDPRTKFMATLTPEQMKTVGLEKIKTEDGKEMFHFNPESFKASREEAIKSLQTGVTPGTEGLKGSAVMQKNVYDAYRTAGFSHNQSLALTAEVGRENSYRSNIIFGTHTDPANSATNLGMISMQGPRHTGLYNFLKSKNLIGSDGQIVHSQESLVAMAQYQKQEMMTGTHGGSARQQQNVRDFLNDPNIDPEQASRVLGKDYIRWRYDDPRYAAHHQYRKNYLSQIEDITNKMKIGDTDGLRREYPEELIQAATRKLETEKSARGEHNLAEYTGAQMGAPGAPGLSVTAQNEGTKKLNEITSYHSAGKGYCGIGTRLAARDLFGDKYFASGLSTGGSAQASSLSRDNNYFQGSGYYNAKQDIEKDRATDPKYLNSLPIGTVISAQGGNVHGDGHVQIKLGPNKWVSYFDQSGVLAQRADGRQYHGYSVHIPNEKGLARISERGFATTVAAPEGQTAPAPTIEEAYDVNQAHPAADKHLDQHTSEVDAQGRPRAIGQAPLMPGEEAAHTNVEIRRREDPSQQPQYEPAPVTPGRVEQAPSIKGLEEQSAPIPVAPTPGDPTAVSPKVVPKGSQSPAAAVGPKETVFTLNKDAYISEVARKHPVIDGPFAGMGPVPDRAGVWKQTVDGFKEAEAKGILKYDQKTGRITIKDMNHPEVQKILKDMKDNNLDRNVFLKQYEEPKPKVETPKPEVKPIAPAPKGLEKFMEKPEPTPPAPAQAPAPAPAPQANVEPPTIKKFVKGEGYAAIKDVPNPNYKPPTVTQTGAPSATVNPPSQTGAPAAKPEEKKDTTPSPAPAQTSAPAPQAQPVQKAEPPKAEPKTDTPKVEVKATGGEAPADSHIQAYPIGGLRGDNSVVVDAQQQPLFTMNTKTEAILPNPQENRVDVVPTQKQTNSANQQAPNPMQQFSDDLENVRTEIKNAFNDMTVESNVTGKTARNPVSDRDSNMIDVLLDVTRTAYKNPTSMRAFNRSRFHETGDPTNDFHHSIGNTA
jgi:hypothetical protein